MNKAMIPGKVDGYRSEVINALRDCIIALWPKQSATMLCNVAADGTAYEVKRPLVMSQSRAVIAFSSSHNLLDITVKQGTVYFKGVKKSIASWPTDGKVTITATTYGYISIDLSTGVPTWNASTVDPADGTDSVEIWMIFVATVTGSGATAKLTELLECQHGDIHSMGNA